MTDKKEEVVQPEVVKIEGNVAIEASGDVTVTTPTERVGDPAGAKAMMDEPLPADVQKAMAENKAPAKPAPKTKRVKTGVDVRNGQDVMKDVPVKQERDYSEGRNLYTAHTMISGSYNGRRINLTKGGEVYLSDREYEIFKSYVDAK